MKIYNSAVRVGGDSPHQKLRDKVEWVKLNIEEQFAHLGELYLYGSLSKSGSWDTEATIDENTDFDFAIQDSTVAAKELTAAGWAELETEAYRDKLTTKVFEGMVDGHKVQISLRTELQTFKEIWSSIDSDFYWKFINKRSPRAMTKDETTAYLGQLYFLVKGYHKPRMTQTRPNTSGIYRAYTGAAYPNLADMWDAVPVQVGEAN